MNQHRRKQISLIGAIGINIAILLGIGLVNIVYPSTTAKEKIFEVTPILSSGNQGGSGQDHKADHSKANKQQQVAPPPAMPRHIDTDGLLIHQANAPLHIDYKELAQIHKIVEKQHKTHPSDSITLAELNALRSGQTNLPQQKGDIPNHNTPNSAGSNLTNASVQNSTFNGTSSDHSNGSTGTGSSKENGFTSSTSATPSIPPVSTSPQEHPAVPPQLVYKVNPTYTEDERDHGLTGRCLIRLVVSSSGNVESASIAQSSGYNELDQAALSASRQYQFTPARDAYGRNVPCYTYIPFDFT